MRFLTRSASCVLAFGAFSLGAFSSPCEGAWGVDGAWAQLGSQNVLSAAAVPDGAAGVFLVWDESPTGTQVHAQRISALGVRQWGAAGVLIGAGHAPVACSDGAGGVIVAFAGSRINVARLSATGVPVWSLTLNGNTQGGHPAICADGAGGAFVTWEDTSFGSFDVFAQHVSSAGAAQWVANGVRVTTLASSQKSPAITSGQSGSAVLMWIDNRAANDAVYAQRILDPAGTNAWTANGVPVCNAANTRSGIRLVPDGAGAFATWTDERNGTGVYRAYMQRVAAADGASLWQPDGQLVATGGAGPTSLPSPVPSGSGILVCWEDHRNGNGDIDAQRYDANGVAQWAQDVAFTQAATDQTNPVAASDGLGGMVAGWQHWPGGGLVFGRMGRVSPAGALLWPVDGVAANVSASMSPITVAAIVSDGSGGAIAALLGAGDGFPRAQRVLANSNLADYDAVITGAIDLPSDEGGYVRLTVGAAIGDLAPDVPAVTGYNIWRRISESVLVVAPTAGVALPADRARGLAALASGAGARLDRAAATSVGFPPGTWESLGMTGALGRSSYLLAAPTRTDSTAAGSADETFVVTVQTTSSALWSVSNAVTAHSVDNLAPTPPQNVAVTGTAAHSLTLSWDSNHEADLAWYAVYRGTSPDFSPSPGNRLATPTSPAYVDNGYTAHFVYKVAAVDRHGNESSPTLLDPTALVGVTHGADPATVSLAAAAPNPATAATVFEWSLPRALAARLEIFDVHGRLVRELFSGTPVAGTRRSRWDLRDGRGAPVPAGVYLARLQSGGVSRERTFVVVP